MSNQGADLPAIFYQAHALAQKGITDVLSEAETNTVLYGVAPIVFKAVHFSMKPPELSKCLEQDNVVFSVLLTYQETAAIFSSVLEQNPYTRFRMGCKSVEKCAPIVSETVAEADKPHGCFFICISLEGNNAAVGVFMYDYAENRSFPVARDHPSKCRILACKMPANHRCGRCKSDTVRYCSIGHQQRDWRFHKRNCKEPTK